MKKFFKNMLLVVSVIVVGGFGGFMLVKCEVLDIPDCISDYTSYFGEDVFKDEVEYEEVFKDNSKVIFCSRPRVYTPEDVNYLISLYREDKRIKEEALRSDLVKENSPGKTVEEIYANYPVREKSDRQERPSAVVSLNDVYQWLSEPNFFDPEGLANVEQRVIDAKRHLNSLFESGKYKRLLSIKQILAIAGREICFDDDKALINLNRLDDLGWSGYGKAHGFMQFSDRAYQSIDALKGFGLIGPDFHGDVALSELSIQAWFWEHCHHEGKYSSFEYMSRFWNKGPTGVVKYDRAYDYFHGDHRRGVKQYLSEVVEKLPAVQGSAENLYSSVPKISPEDMNEKFYGPQVPLEEEAPQFSKSYNHEFQLPSWDDSDKRTTLAASP